MKRVMVKDQWWAPRVLSRNIVEDDDDDDWGGRKCQARKVVQYITIALFYTGILI
jgi:hypothetical protein